MRVKLKIKDFDGKKAEIEKEIPSKDHLQSQIKYKHQVFRDRTKYTRKSKHKKQNEE